MSWSSWGRCWFRIMGGGLWIWGPVTWPAKNLSRSVLPVPLMGSGVLGSEVEGSDLGVSGAMNCGRGSPRSQSGSWSWGLGSGGFGWRRGSLWIFLISSCASWTFDKGSCSRFGSGTWGDFSLRYLAANCIQVGRAIPNFSPVWYLEWTNFRSSRIWAATVAA